MTPVEDAEDAATEPEHADSQPAGIGNEPLAVGRRLLLIGVVVLLTVTAAVTVVLLLASDSSEPEDARAGHHLGVGPSWEEIAADMPMHAGRRYSDEALGLYELIDETVFYRPYFARGRTADEAFEKWIKLRNYQRDEAIGHERERLQFEFDIESVLLNAVSGLPADLAEGGRLEDAYYGWMVECLSPAGFPESVLDPEVHAEIPIYLAEDEELASYASVTGFTRDEFYDLRFDCAQQAVRYPTLDHGTRYWLIGRLKEHYLRAVYDYLDHPEVISVPVDDPATTSDIETWGGTCGRAVVADPRNLTRSDLLSPRNCGSALAMQELSGFKLLKEIGILQLLDQYIVNVPRSAVFISRKELGAIGVNIFHDLEIGDTGEERQLRFEVAVLSNALNDALYSMPDHPGNERLHEAFFAELAECGQQAAGPEMELFVIRDGIGEDPRQEEIISYLGVRDYIAGLSYFEYLELLHECARRAATYPTLDPAERDELLAPQRAHFASVILDRLGNDLPLTEVPERYRSELQDLRENGW